MGEPDRNVPSLAAFINEIVGSLASDKHTARAWESIGCQLMQFGWCNLALLEQVRPAVLSHIASLSETSLRELWGQTKPGSGEDPHAGVDDWIRMKFEMAVIDELTRLGSG